MSWCAASSVVNALANACGSALRSENPGSSVARSSFSPTMLIAGVPDCDNTEMSCATVPPGKSKLITACVPPGDEGDFSTDGVEAAGGGESLAAPRADAANTIVSRQNVN